MNKWIQGGYCALFALLPWSLECSLGSWRINLPSEPLIGLLGLGLGWVVLTNPERLRQAFSGNRFLLASAAWIGWMAVCATCSSMPLVSWKYWVVETGHWWVFAAGVALFPAVWQKAFPFFAVSTAGVVVYSLAHHAMYHFRADQAILAPMPFFPEHTMYGAVIAMVIFKPGRLFKPYRPWLLFDLLLLSGLFFSFSRGAWGSVIVAVAVGLFLHFREKRRLILAFGLLFCLTAVFFRAAIADFASKDVSLQERGNRYSCAFRMAQDRPWLGFGPGTYQFQYLPYQQPEEMTRISVTGAMTTRIPGRGGGAHSEYLQALSETGLPGLLLFLIMVATAFRGVASRYARSNSPEDQIIMLLLILALLAYFLHGLINNLLHDGRVAALVWGMMAVGSSGGSKQ